MQVNQEILNQVILPGDKVGQLHDVEPDKEIKKKDIVRIGRGLMQIDNDIVSNKAGILRKTRQNLFFVENNQKRYVPALDDMVIGTAIERAGEYYRVDIGAHQPAILHYLAFDGASKRNRPDIKPGSLIYARVSLANKDLEPEITCLSPGGKRKDWVTGEGLFGELKEGYVIECSLGMCRKLLLPDCYILQELGNKVGFEIAVGLNGRVWIKGKTNRDTILVANAILNSEFMSKPQIKSMIDTLLKKIGK